MFKKIDTTELSTINRGVLPGPSGTCVPSPFPRPRPQPDPIVDGITGGRGGTGIGGLGDILPKR